MSGGKDPVLALTLTIPDGYPVASAGRAIKMAGVGIASGITIDESSSIAIGEMLNAIMGGVPVNPRGIDLMDPIPAKSLSTNQYQIDLDGYHKGQHAEIRESKNRDWVAIFDNLPVGAYTLIVQVADAQSSGQAPTTFSVEQAPVILLVK